MSVAWVMSVNQDTPNSKKKQTMVKFYQNKIHLSYNKLSIYEHHAET